MEVISLYYSDEDNRMFDLDGNVYNDIFRIISPGRFEYLKKVRGTEYIRKAGVIFELVFDMFEDTYVESWG